MRNKELRSRLKLKSKGRREIDAIRLLKAKDVAILPQLCFLTMLMWSQAMSRQLVESLVLADRTKLSIGDFRELKVCG